MKSLLTVTAGLLVLALPLHAQRMGQANANAPTVGQSIEFKAGTVEVKYTAIVWGKIMDTVTDKEKGERARRQINNAPEPLGTLKNSADTSIGGKAVAAGDYKLFFAINGDLKWNLKLVGPSTIEIPLDLKDVSEDHKRLTLAITAGDSDNSGRLHVAFGKQRASLDVKPGAGEKKAEPAAGEKGEKKGGDKNEAPKRQGSFFQVLTGSF